MVTQVTTDTELEEMKNPNISVPLVFFDTYVELFLIILYKKNENKQ